MGDIACEMCGGWPACVCRDDYDDDWGSYSADERPSSKTTSNDWLAEKIGNIPMSDKTAGVVVDVVSLANEVTQDIKRAFRRFFG
jgi:hypothetical protein